jgi:hypothetical protein
MPEHRKGDLLLAFISSGYAHAGGPPAGWTLVRQDVKAHDDLAVQTYWRIAGPWEGERPRYDWPLVSLESHEWMFGPPSDGDLPEPCEFSVNAGPPNRRRGSGFQGNSQTPWRVHLRVLIDPPS